MSCNGSKTNKPVLAVANNRIPKPSSIRHCYQYGLAEVTTQALCQRVVLRYFLLIYKVFYGCGPISLFVVESVSLTICHALQRRAEFVPVAISGRDQFEREFRYYFHSVRGYLEIEFIDPDAIFID
ncbi:hypothetical protein [Candidatus Thiodiazotropha sp. CDECU1]|uniref:hypothetical protein n=1 Tax=Candidatus Thiodiazotropha sp. CDECU1 TaxID=3065865 RepID=UPI00292EA6B9|nr:hypothetical protein [Candidatus Thiodiazotropha sp. CDECU1]